MGKIISALRKINQVAGPITGAKAMVGDIKSTIGNIKGKLGKAWNSYKTPGSSVNVELYMEKKRKIKKSQGLRPEEIEKHIARARDKISKLNK
jgi:hypothetical protein